MQKQVYGNRNRRMGSLIVGLVVAELGLLQFLKLQFGIDWPHMWPLFLTIPGLALVLGALVSTSSSDDQN